MRSLIFILAAVLLVPPAPAGACAMDPEGSAGAMTHALHMGMEMAPEAFSPDPGSHDCCDEDAADTRCGTAAHCATVTPSVAFAGPLPGPAQVRPERLSVPRAGFELPPPHDHPPYRPPSV